MTTASAITELIQALRAGTLGSEWFSGRVVDDDDLVVSALVLGLAPALDHRLAEWGIELAPRAKAKLGAIRQSSRERYAAIITQLGEILSALQREAVRPIVLKGCYLAAQIYPAPELRPMNDIDLLFREEELEAVDRVLVRLGYERHSKSRELGPGVVKHTRTYRLPGPSTETPNPYLSSASARTVEPHSSLEESWFGLRCDITPGVFERAQPFPVAGNEARGLCAEDLLLHLCVHLAFHLIMGAPSFVQLMDMDVVLRKFADPEGIPFRWADFLGRVRSTRSAPFIYASLRLAGKLWGSPVPAEVEQQLSEHCPGPIRRYVGGLSLEDVLARTQNPPLTTIPQRLRRGLEDRLETSRWAVGLPARWRVWRTLFAVARTDTGRMILSSGCKRKHSEY